MLAFPSWHSYFFFWVCGKTIMVYDNLILITVTVAARQSHNKIKDLIIKLGKQ